MLDEINRNEVGRTCLAGFLPSCKVELTVAQQVNAFTAALDTALSRLIV